MVYPVGRRERTLHRQGRNRYDHSYDEEVFYLGLALDSAYVEGWVEGCLERIGEDNPDEEQIFRDPWEDETQREVVMKASRPTVR